jgi:hypothetical protein
MSCGARTIRYQYECDRCGLMDTFESTIDFERDELARRIEGAGEGGV